MTVMRIRRLAQLTLPVEVRRALKVDEGDFLEAKIVKDGVLLKPVAIVERKPASRRPRPAVTRARGRRLKDLKAEEEWIADQIKQHRRARKDA